MRYGTILLLILSSWASGSFSLAHAQLADSAHPRKGAETTPREVEAKRSFEEGRVSLERERFEDALRFFERAYDLSGRSEMLYNIGTVLDRLRRDADAARYFERYLDVQPDARNRPAVEARLEVLHARLAAEHVGGQALAPSPAQVAQLQVSVEAPVQHQGKAPEEMATSESSSRDDSRKPLRKKWWFWTGLVVVAGGGAVAAVLLTRDREQVQEPLVGSQDAFTQALWSR